MSPMSRGRAFFRELCYDAMVFKNVMNERRKPRIEAAATKEKHMNVVAPIRPQITLEERARRKAAVDYARASVRLEGFVVSPFAEDLNRRYIDGEITREEMTAALLAHHAP